MKKLDKVDKKIIQILQKNARTAGIDHWDYNCILNWSSSYVSFEEITGIPEIVVGKIGIGCLEQKVWGGLVKGKLHKAQKKGVPKTFACRIRGIPGSFVTMAED